MGIDPKNTARIAAVAALAIAACTQPRGILFHDVTTPFDTNLRDTPAGTRVAFLDAKAFRSLYRVRFEIAWDSNGIGDILRDQGLETATIADEQNFSVLFGIVGSNQVRVGGFGPGEGPASRPVPAGAIREIDARALARGAEEANDRAEKPSR